MNAIEANIAFVQRRICDAAAACGRSVDEIALLAVAKAQPAAALQAAWRAGLRRFGENYVQEAAGKIAGLTGLALEWHLIGHLQSNKARQAAALFDWVQTVDRPRTGVVVTGIGVGLLALLWLAQAALRLAGRRRS
jgi:uncharacterized pyridoxal phosphate-containing UPF0001 family protein